MKLQLPTSSSLLSVLCRAHRSWGAHIRMCAQLTAPELQEAFPGLPSGDCYVMATQGELYYTFESEEERERELARFESEDSPVDFAVLRGGPAGDVE